MAYRPTVLDPTNDPAPGSGARGDILFFASKRRLTATILACGAGLVPLLLLCAVSVLGLVEDGYGRPGAWLAAPLAALPHLLPALVAAAAAAAVWHWALEAARIGRDGGFVAGIDGQAIYPAGGPPLARDRIGWTAFLPGVALFCARHGAAGGRRLVAVPTGLVAGGDVQARRDMRAACSPASVTATPPRLDNGQI